MTIHTRNLQYLAIEIFKVKTGISPTIMTEIFKFCDNATHNLRSGQVLERNHNRTNNFDVESISTLGAKIWALFPENLRQSTSLNRFKQSIKNWNPSDCPCRLCKIYVQNVGFIYLIIRVTEIEFFKNFQLKIFVIESNLYKKFICFIKFLCKICKIIFNCNLVISIEYLAIFTWYNFFYWRELD